VLLLLALSALLPNPHPERPAAVLLLLPAVP
jgi:hypothetical protein